MTAKRRMRKSQPHKGPVIYQAKSGAIELRGDVRKETLWATQAQIADIFNIERSVVTKHIANILKSQEVVQKSNVQKMHIAKSGELKINDNADRKSTRLNSSHPRLSRMPSSA